MCSSSLGPISLKDTLGICVCMPKVPKEGKNGGGEVIAAWPFPQWGGDGGDFSLFLFYKCICSLQLVQMPYGKNLQKKVHILYYILLIGNKKCVIMFIMTHNSTQDKPNYLISFLTTNCTLSLRQLKVLFSNNLSKNFNIQPTYITSCKFGEHIISTIMTGTQNLHGSGYSDPD